MRIALDTNVLAYAEGVNGMERRNRALALIRRIPKDTAVVPAQVLGELFEATHAMPCWPGAPHSHVVDTSPDIMMAAADLETDHSSGNLGRRHPLGGRAIECRLLLSEDLEDRFTWADVTVVNPFALPQHALPNALLGETR